MLSQLPIKMKTSTTKMKTSTTERSPLGSDTCSASLARDIEILRTELHPIMAQMEDLRRKHREALSREFIAANQLTRDKVEMSSGDGKPWFGTAYEFGKWLARQSKKAWAEWNGRIYHAADLANGRMPAMPGDVDHLPNVDVLAPAGEKTPTKKENV